MWLGFLSEIISWHNFGGDAFVGHDWVQLTQMRLRFCILSTILKFSIPITYICFLKSLWRKYILFLSFFYPVSSDGFVYKIFIWVLTINGKGLLSIWIVGEVSVCASKFLYLLCLLPYKTCIFEICDRLEYLNRFIGHY